MSDPTAELLDRHHIAAELLDVDLISIDIDLSTSHQVRGQAVDPAHVDRLAEGYRRGDQLPPLIVRNVDGRLVLVGGMHRTHAARLAEIRNHPAYMVDVDDHTARLLAVDDNARHGLPLSPDEARRQAGLLVEGGCTVEEAAAAVGLTRTGAHDAVTIHRTTARAERAGCADAWAALARLGKADNRRHPPQRALLLAQIEDDVCFAAAAEVVARKGLPAQTVRSLVGRLEKLPNINDRLAEIGDLDDQGSGYVGDRYDVHAGDDNDTVRLTRALIELVDIDVDQAVAGIRGRDSEDRTDRRLVEAGRKIIALSRALDRRRGRAAT